MPAHSSHIRKIIDITPKINSYSLKNYSTLSLIATGSEDKTIKIFDFISKKCIKTFYNDGCEIYDIIYAEKPNLLISCSRDGTIKYYSLRFFKCVKVIKDSNSWISNIIYCQEFSVIISAGYDEEIKIRTLESGGLLMNIDK